MHVKRLQQLSRLLRDLERRGKADYFSLCVWHDKASIGAEGAQPVRAGVKPDCGTVACAIGHAALSPVFIKQGLKLNDTKEWPCFGKHTASDAVSAFFEIDVRVVLKLFFSSQYPAKNNTTPEEVANRIDEYIKREINYDTL